MRKFLSGQIWIRGLLIALTLFVWCIKVPERYKEKDTLFCYTRDCNGNKALIKDDGTVYVEDIFVMEIPAVAWDFKETVTVTIIVEDEEGNRKTKQIRLNEKEP